MIFSLFCSMSFAQKEKIVERSAKKTPDWIGMSTNDYFSVSATAETLDAAQKQCMNDIRQYIINSIAVNVVSSENFYQNQTYQNEVVDILQNYSSQVDTKSAALPYLCGLSLSKADDIYWERRMIKNEKRYYYVCHVKYPFTEQERRNAIAAFKKIDNSYTERLETIRNNAETFDNLAYIDQALAELNALISYFFDDTRLNEAKMLQSRFRNMGGEVALATDSAVLGYFRYHLTLHGRRVFTDRTPKLNSDYAMNMRVVRDDDEYVLLYDEQGIAGEENKIDIKYSFSGHTLAYTVVFNPLENKIFVRPYGTIVVEPASSETEWVVNISLRSQTQNEFIVSAVEVYIPELSVLTMTSGKISFAGKGTHLLQFTSTASAQDNHDKQLADGVMKLYNPKNGMETDVKFILPYKLRKN